ncbi:MAG: ANTAR domain-containing protein [Pseudonocardiales bacterium]
MSEPRQRQHQVADGPQIAQTVRPQSVAVASNGATHRASDLPPIDVLELFTDLAAACVPAFCDGLQFDLVAEGVGDFSATYPPSADGAGHVDGATAPGTVDGTRTNGAKHAEVGSSPGCMVIAVRPEPAAGEPPVAGKITCTWRDPSRPTHADALVGRLLAEQAVAKLRLETLGAALKKQLTRASNLEEALATNREIGQAIGILMATDHVTAEQAFEKLRTASQHTHRKLREIAGDVTETGALTIAPELLNPQPRRAPDGRADTASRAQRRTRGAQPLAAAPDET